MTGQTYQMKKGDGNVILTKRGLLLHDSVTFLVLLLVTAALYGVTLFLFRSFEGHRDDLAVRWSARGEAALKQGKPDQAVGALRVALSYAPDNTGYQILLAQALADSGKTEEATNYYLNLWEARPGDGSINLALARLARKKGDTQKAIDSYRAAIFGDWHGDGVVRRRSVRLELADYLTEQHDFEAARAEILISAGNAPDDATLNLLFGDKLAAAGDLNDALTYYRRAIADSPKDRVPLEKAGRTAYALGDYAMAHRLLTRALDEDTTPEAKAQDAEINGMAQNAARLLELSLSRELAPRERAEHLVAASTIAKARLNACTTQLGAASAPQAIQDLKARWKTIGAVTQRALAENATAQDGMAQLIYDTEFETAAACGAPAGDDALLLKLAQSHAMAQPQQNGAPE